LRYVVDAVAQIRRALDGRVPLIGFSGSPYTLACYMIEGGASTDFRRTKEMMYAAPDLLHRILSINADAVTAYLNAQIHAGAQIVMVFDTWGGSLAGAAFREFSLRYLQRVVGGVERTCADGPVPLIVYTKGGGAWLEDLADTGADAIGLDWMTDIGAARARIGTRVALQGNLDPGVLFGTPEIIGREVRAVLSAYGHGNGHVFNLGHGVSQFTDPEKVGTLVDLVHAASRAYH
jgi:uroporphyrinogen decarboxylase